MSPLTLTDIESFANQSKTILQEISFPNLIAQPKVYLKREDLIHPEISGNKWYKLKYNLLEASKREYKTLLTFGGAYSNHIHATASAGRIFGFKTISIIRGEQTLPLNPTLRHATNCGMELHYLSRTEYRKRNDPEFQQTLKKNFGDVYLIPEGGTNMLALKGVGEIVSGININYDYLCTSVGTGGTLSGLICGAEGRASVLGFSSLKGGEFLNDVVLKLTHQYSGRVYENWKLVTDYNFGGYAKITSEFVEFISQFEKINGIPLDPIYTGKMLFGIYDMIKKETFKMSDVIVAIHTGGLQGIEGMREKILKKLEIGSQRT